MVVSMVLEMAVGVRGLGGLTRQGPPSSMRSKRILLLAFVLKLIHFALGICL